MLEEARRKYGNRDVITLEEYIAEDFREFMLMGAKDNRSFGRKFIDLLKRLANMVQNYHLFQPSSTYYFNAINKGKFKNAVPKRVHVSRRMTTRQQLDEALNEFDSIYSDDPAVQRECEEIKAKAIANGTFMKAPNGKQSKLDERQWLHVRTKAFKEWFGDWERLAELEIELSKFNSDNSEKNSNFTSEAKPFKGDASNKKHYLTIAPYFREKLSSQNRAELERKTAEVKERVINFAKALGLNISVVETNAGVFEGSPEISYTYHVTGGTQEEIDLFTSLMGDISNEYQDAVIAANYVDENSKELVNAWELNYNVPKGSSIEEVMQYLSENNIDGTFNLNTNTLTIIAFSKEQSAEIVKYLKEKKYEHKQTKLQNSRYLENGDRRNIYKSWLETHVGESNRLLDNACRKADFICEAAAKFSRKDQEAERIKAAREAAEKWDREHQAEENVLNSTPSQSIESLQKEYDELKGKVSKVVDENGEPMTTWHSSPSEIENNTFRDKYTVTIDKGEEWITNKDINDYIKEGFIVSEEDIKAYKEGKSITISKPNGIYSSSKKEVSNTYTQLEYEAYDKFDEKIQHKEDTRAETWSLEEEGLFNKHLKDIKETDKDNPYVYGSKQYNDYFYNKAAELAKKEMLERHPEGRKEFVNPTNPFNYTNNVLGSEIEIFSSLKNPLIIDAHNSNWNSIEFNGRIYSTRTLEEYARNNGYDGVIVKNVYDIGGHARRGSIMTSTVVTALKPNQIKSATDNNGQYSRENDNILGYYLDRLSNRAFERAFINLATILEGLGARGKAFLHLVESNKSFKSFKEIVDFLNGKGLNVEYLDMFKKVDESLSEKEFKELMQELRDSQNKTEQENIDYGKKNIEELGFEDGKTYSYEEVLEKIEINGAAKIIWDIIEPIVKKLGLKITFDASDTRRNGYFVPRDGRVVITGYGAKSHIGETFVHELVHAVTTKIIDAVNSGNTEGLTQKQIDAVKGLQKLYEKTKKESGNSDAYRNSNIFEYVAHLSNEQHKRELETYEKSFLEKFVDFILDILGIKNSYDLAKQYLRDIIDDGSYLVNNGITTIGDILESKRRRDITNSDLLPTEVKAIQEYIESILKDKKIKQPNKAFYLVSNGNLYKFNSSLKQYKANRKKDRHGFEIISAWSLEGLSDSIIEELEDVIRAGKNVDFFINKQGGEYEVGDSLGSYLGFGDQGTTSGNDRLDNGTLQGEPYRGTSGQQDSRNSISIRTMRNTKGEVISMAQYRALNNLPAPNSFATLTDQQQQAVEEYGLSEEDYDGLTEQAKEYLKHCLL